MQFVSGTSADLATDVMMGLARYRHRVFVEMLGWPLQTPEHGLELDQFDREDTVYVVARDAIDEVVGTARLLPTSRPYLLGEVFPQLLHGQPLPSTPEVWELSRFAAVDFNSANKTTPMCQLSPVAVDLLRETMRVAANLGAERLITVTWLGVERLLRKAGIRAHRAGAARHRGRIPALRMLDRPGDPAMERALSPQSAASRQLGPHLVARAGAIYRRSAAPKRMAGPRRGSLGVTTSPIESIADGERRRELTVVSGLFWSTSVVIAGLLLLLLLYAAQAPAVLLAAWGSASLLLALAFGQEGLRRSGRVETRQRENRVQAARRNRSREAGLPIG